MSAEVNFLPWREQKRITAQRRFMVASLASVMFGLVLLALVAGQQQSTITHRPQQLGIRKTGNNRWTSSIMRSD